MKKIKLIILGSFIIFSCTVGYVFASSINSSPTTSTKKIEIIEVPKGKEKPYLPVPTKINPLSNELRQMSNEVFGNNVNTSLSQDEKVELYKEGFTFEDIELAEILANEKKENDVHKLLKENQKEIKALKDFITKEKKFNTNNIVSLDQKTIDYWVSKGYHPIQVREAFVIGQKFNLKIESVFEMIDTGEIVKLHYQLYQQSLKEEEKNK